MIKSLFHHISLKQIFIKNTLWLYTGQFISKIIKVALVVFAARILGPTEFGTFNYTTYFLSFFFLFSDLGLSAYLIREFQKEWKEKKEFISSIFFLRFVLIFLISSVTFAYYFFLNDANVKTIYLILLGIFIFGSLKDSFLCFTRAHNRMEYESIISIIESVVTTLVGLIVLFATHSLVFFTFAYLIGSCVGFLCSLLFTFPFLPSPFSFRLSLIKKILLFCFPFLFSPLVVVLMTQIDVIAIKFLKGIESVGHYSAGLKLFQILILLPAPVITALYPLLSGLTKDKEKIAHILKQTLAFSLIIGVPLACGGFVLGSDIILTFFGTEYSEGILSFQILSLLFPIIFIIMTLDDALVSLNYQVQNMFFTLFSAGINIILNLIFIPPFGIAGAAGASLLSQLVNLTLTFRLTHKALGKNFFDASSFCRYIFLSFSMGCLLFILTMFHFPLMIMIGSGVFFYVSGLFILKEKQFLLLLQSIRLFLTKTP